MKDGQHYHLNKNINFYGHINAELSPREFLNTDDNIGLFNPEPETFEFLSLDSVTRELSAFE